MVNTCEVRQPSGNIVVDGKSSTTVILYKPNENSGNYPLNLCRAGNFSRPKITVIPGGGSILQVNSRNVDMVSIDHGSFVYNRGVWILIKSTPESRRPH